MNEWKKSISDGFELQSYGQLNAHSCSKVMMRSEMDENEQEKGMKIEGKFGKI